MAGNEFGPLVAPGWPDLKGGPDLGKDFLTGFQIAANVAGKQQALENQIANMALAQRRMELNADLREKQFGLAQERLAMDSYNKGQMLDLAGQRMGLQQDVFNLATQKYNDSQEGKQGLLSVEAQLADEGLNIASDDYIKRANELATPFIGKVPNNIYNAWQRQMFANHNQGANAQIQAFKLKQNSFNQDLGRTLYGNPLIQDYGPLDHPELLTPETKGGGWFFDTGPVVKTGNYKIPAKDPGTGVIGTRIVSQGDIDRLIQQRKELDQERAKLPTYVSRYDLGVVPPGNDQQVRVIAPDGRHGSIPAAAAQDYINNRGYTLEPQ